MDYEDDFSWNALDPNVDPQEHQNLLLVRFLIENGYIPEHFDGAPPPASKEVVANLEERKVKIFRSQPEKSSSPGNAETSYEKIFKVMPCAHAFHSEYILPWLEKTNSCPLCRHELRTDDPSYERRRAERARAVERERDLEILHNSMFG